MRCPTCGADSGVSETRETVSGMRRRRRCVNGHRFTTYEIIAADPAAMRDGRVAIVPMAKLEELKAAIDRIAPTDAISCVISDADPVLTD